MNFLEVQIFIVTQAPSHKINFFTCALCYWLHIHTNVRFWQDEKVYNDQKERLKIAMYEIDLRIEKKDWLFILIMGVLFSMMLSSLGYVILDEPLFDGALFGSILGSMITLFSLIYISFMNNILLPTMPKKYWLMVAMIFSFLCGFAGTLFSIILAFSLHIKLIDSFYDEAIYISTVIGVLTYIFGTLIYRFVKIRNEKEIVDKEYIQSRLSSLERQLNPHFLFNALNSIAELIHQNPQKAEEAILKVSSFLRNSMDEKSVITLEDELKNVKDYVELENIRFSGKIRVNIPDVLPHINIPKFSIQLIVENAIKHGFDPNKDGLLITISFDETHKSIKIKNDGKSMSSINFGIGLKNLDNRLKLLCGGYLKINNLAHVEFEIILEKCYENFNS